ncbi:MAG TPA: folate-binding protein [Micavibrio sp.]
MSSGFFVRLPDRGAVRIGGGDRRAFLQGLITNDVALLDRQPCLYACLLTPQGKFLHDFFMSEQDGIITLECEGGERARDLSNRLKKFKLRSKIDLEHIEIHDVFSVIDDGETGGVPDPRHPDLGLRTTALPSTLPEKPFSVWDSRRIALGIPDGSRDMAIEKSTMLESGIDKFNGVSFSKGCFMGQELTARMHYRGLAKKHLVSVRASGGSPVPAPGTDLLTHDGRLIGEMRSGCGDAGLALVKDDMLSLLPEAGLSHMN